ncbi:MAG: DMT family transporter [Clostridiaceae bacterium]|jgi:drug/metabolite transporter (DMT)-like permease|nr:DMT family transporter [Bacillota bacterium]NLI38597.1 DMT family transporter [Clostridiaceae bacterium]
MTRQIKADLSILSITVVWGSSFILMKNITENIPYYAYLFLRFSIAGIILAMIFARQMGKINRKALIQGTIIGFTLFAGMSLQYVGLNYTSASHSAFITGLNVVMVPVISAFYLKKKPPVRAAIGVLLATTGLFLLSGGFSGDWNIGDTLTLLCAVCFALQIIFIDKFTQESDARHLAVVQIFSAAVMYGILWAGYGLLTQPVSIAINSRVILTALYTGALGTAFAYSVQTIAQQYTTPTRTALLLTFEPVFGALFALTIPGPGGITEKLTLSTAMGCLLIFVGMMVTEVRFRDLRKSTTENPHHNVTER